jgi:hypothetical protein
MKNIQSRLFLGFVAGLLLLSPCDVAAASARDLKVNAEPRKTTIGEPVFITVTGHLEKNEEVGWPSAPEVSKFSVKRADATPHGSSFVAHLTLVGFEPGTFKLDGLKIRFKASGQGAWKETKLPAVSIEIISLVTGDVEKLDVKPLKGLVHSRKPFLIIPLLLLAAAALLLWLRLRKHPVASTLIPKVAAHVMALERLRKLIERDLISRGLIQEFYVELSLIVRHYLENRFNMRAPEMTTEEFLEYMKSHEALSPNHKELLRDFMGHCDLVKFARYDPVNEEIDRSLSAARRLIEETKDDKVTEQN